MHKNWVKAKKTPKITINYFVENFVILKNAFIFAPRFGKICKTKFQNHDSVAQLVEHYTFNVRVLGSNPSGITKKASNFSRLFC